MKKLLTVLSLSSLLLIVGCGDEDPTSFPSNSNDYETTNSEVGCDSKLSDDRKDDVWEGKYKNHWMTWTGDVMLAETASASLQMDGAGTQDLKVVFGKGESGYHLEKGQKIVVRFVMKKAGGCVFAFRGEYAQILRKIDSIEEVRRKLGEFLRKEYSKNKYNKNGKKEGPWITYHTNMFGPTRLIASKGTYKNGKKDGPWVYYWGDIGAIRGQQKTDKQGREYHVVERKETYKDGKKDGPQVGYEWTGKLTFDYTYKDGKQDGLQVTYHNNGQLWSKGIYKNDVEVKCLFTSNPKRKDYCR